MSRGRGLRTSAAEALRPWRRGWQQAVAQRVVKDRLRRGFAPWKSMEINGNHVWRRRSWQRNAA